MRGDRQLPAAAGDMSSGPIPGGRGWLLAVCASRVGVYMVYIAYAATLPLLEREWHLTGTAAGSIASAFQVAYALSLMVCSELADRIGARRIFLVGSAGSAGAAILFAALARDYWTGLGLYTLLALALGGTYTTGILLVAENVPVERRGGAMGAYIAAHSLALAIALVVAGAAIPRGGYVLAFWLLCVGPIAGSGFAWLALRRTASIVALRGGGLRFGGAVRPRPADPSACRGAEWAAYVYLRDNPAGMQREWWYHRFGCGLWFVAERDTRTNVVHRTERWPPAGGEPDVG